MTGIPQNHASRGMLGLWLLLAMVACRNRHGDANSVQQIAEPDASALDAMPLENLQTAGIAPDAGRGNVTFQLATWLAEHGNPSFPPGDPCAQDAGACRCTKVLRFAPSGREALVCSGFEPEQKTFPSLASERIQFPHPTPTVRVLTVVDGRLVQAWRGMERAGCSVSSDGSPTRECSGYARLMLRAESDALVVTSEMQEVPPGAPPIPCETSCDECRDTARSMKRSDPRWWEKQAAITARVCSQIGRYMWQGSALVRSVDVPPVGAPTPTGHR